MAIKAEILHKPFFKTDGITDECSELLIFLIYQFLIFKIVSIMPLSLRFPDTSKKIFLTFSKILQKYFKKQTLLLILPHNVYISIYFVQS